MSAFPTTIPVRLNPDGLIDVDVNCPSCGYNLRMQKPAQECPECGQAIDVTDAVDSDRLSAANPPWRATIARGAKLLFLGVALLPLGFVPGILLLTVGLWLLTTREPDRHEAWFHRGTRLSARMTAAMASLGSVALAALIIRYRISYGAGVNFSLAGLLQEITRLSAISNAMVYDILFAGIAASLSVAALESWRYLFKLAARADGPNVARACRTAWKQFLWGVGVLVVLALIANIAQRLDIKWFVGEAPIIAAGGFLLVGAVCFWLWIVTLGLTRKLANLLAIENTPPAND